ncbi:MAG: patatin-like phospholipase family protein [Acidimicrobiales bacterium]|nr:patatin-like phospholipase family protein [Acidimicrobiales bacterium]
MAPSIGLVLGAGGATGGAFHAGALTALADVTGWDARTAELVVGTSAGAAVASGLRAGLSPADLAHRAAGRPLSPEGEALLAGAGPPVDPLRLPPARHWWPPVPAAPRLLVTEVLQPWRWRAGVALAAALPEGTRSTDPLAERARAVHAGRRWPERPLWICAVRLGDGARVVLGRDVRVDADIGDAVAASCAVPGLFAPRRIGRDRYVDGGVHAPTNADLLAGLGFDLVVVSSPMSATADGLRAAADRIPRAWHRHTLDTEVAAVRRMHTPVLVLEPTAADLRVMGVRALDAGRAAAVAGQVEAGVRRRLQRPEAAADAPALDVLRAAAAA